MFQKRKPAQVCIKLFGVISISIKSARSDGNPHKERDVCGEGDSGWEGLELVGWLVGRGVRLWDVGEFYGKFDKNWCARTFSCTDAEPYIHIEGGTLCLSNLLKL